MTPAVAVICGMAAGRGTDNPEQLRAAARDARNVLEALGLIDPRDEPDPAPADLPTDATTYETALPLLELYRRHANKRGLLQRTAAQDASALDVDPRSALRRRNALIRAGVVIVVRPAESVPGSAGALLRVRKDA